MFLGSTLLCIHYSIPKSVVYRLECKQPVGLYDSVTWEYTALHSLTFQRALLQWDSLVLSDV